jgi:hypothetical protein
MERYMGMDRSEQASYIWRLNSVLDHLERIIDMTKQGDLNAVEAMRRMTQARLAYDQAKANSMEGERMSTTK